MYIVPGMVCRVCFASCVCCGAVRERTYDAALSQRGLHGLVEGWLEECGRRADRIARVHDDLRHMCENASEHADDTFRATCDAGGSEGS